jgi:hypothetical protein
MEAQSLVTRVDMLEERLQNLVTLPDRMSAVEGRLGSVEGRLGVVEGRLGVVEGRLGVVEGRLGVVEGRLGVVEDRLSAVAVQIVQLRTTMHDGFSALRESDEETRRHMRILHEEVLTRIAQLGEH